MHCAIKPSVIVMKRIDELLVIMDFVRVEIDTERSQ